MPLNLKILGLALFSICAFGAVVASAAFATAEIQTDRPSLDTESTVFTGSQDGQDKFTADAGAMECSSISYQSTVTLPTATASFTPAYSGCVVGGFAGGEVKMNGCEYLLHLEGETGGVFQGSTDIVCSGSNEMMIIGKAFGTTKCTIDIPPQTGLKTMKFTNVGSGETSELTADVSFTSVTYTQTAGTGIGACSKASDTSNGSYSGKILITGETDPGTTHVGLFVN